MSAGDVRVILSSAARTATGTSSAVAARPEATEVAITMNLTAVSGTTPSMTLSVEWSADGGSVWATSDPADAFTAVTASGPVVKSFVVKAPTYRLRWTITGTTPSFTFSVRDWSA